MPEYTPEIIERLGTAAGLLVLVGYTARLIIPYFLRKLDQKDEKIDQLTKTFTETINHKTSEWTQAMNRLAGAIEDLVNKK